MINFVCHQYNLYFFLTESLQVSCNPVPGKGFKTSPTSDKHVDEDTYSAMNGILLVIVARMHNPLALHRFHKCSHNAVFIHSLSDSYPVLNSLLHTSYT